MTYENNEAIPDRAFDIITMMKRDPGRKTGPEIQKCLGLPRSTCKLYLSILFRAGKLCRTQTGSGSRGVFSYWLPPTGATVVRPEPRPVPSVVRPAQPQLTQPPRYQPQTNQGFQPAATGSSCFILDFLNPRKIKMGIYDIEASSLKGDYGIILCAGFRTWGQGTKEMFRINLAETDLLRAEETLLNDLVATMKKYGGLTAYYGSGFDLPMIRSRCLFHGIELPKRVLHMDPYYTVKTKFNLSSNSMERVNQVMSVKLPSLPQKTHTIMKTSMRAVYSHDYAALSEIVNHCAIDIDILYHLVEKLASGKLLPDTIKRL